MCVHDLGRSCLSKPTTPQTNTAACSNTGLDEDDQYGRLRQYGSAGDSAERRSRAALPCTASTANTTACGNTGMGVMGIPFPPYLSPYVPLPRGFLVLPG